MLFWFGRIKLQMEMDAKESEIEQLMQRLALNNSDTASVHSGNDLDADDSVLGK